MSEHKEATLKELFRLIKLNIKDDMQICKIRFNILIIRMQTRYIKTKNLFLNAYNQYLLAKLGMKIMIRRMRG